MPDSSGPSTDPPERSRDALERDWVAVDGKVDPVAWAQLLRRAHRVALTRGRVPPIVRDVVADSWARALAAGVDPDRPVPRRWDAAQAAEALAGHPVGALLPRIIPMLRAATSHAGQVAVLTDANGIALWADGDPEACERAAPAGFAPGHDLSEAAIGTNAIGTALVLDHPVQIFSAEHFNRLLHAWSCVAAPLYDPETHALLGALDLSGTYRAAHPHSLALISLAASAVESHLAARTRRRDARLTASYLDSVPPSSRRYTAIVTRLGRVILATPAGWLGDRIDVPSPGTVATPASGGAVVFEPLNQGEGYLVRRASTAATGTRPALRLEALGARPARLARAGAVVELQPRHAEVVTLLLLHPDGLSGDDLGRQLHGDARRAVTVRAEVSRLRKIVGPVIAANPYRVQADVTADFLDVRRQVKDGELIAAVRSYPGPLLPWSRSPAIEEARRHLDHLVRASVHTRDDPDLLYAWVQGGGGASDGAAHRRLLALLDPADHRRAIVEAAHAALERRSPTPS
jgi:hypothetical protein